MEEQYPEDFLERLCAVTGKRARVVIDYILKHGQITTEELETHPDYVKRALRRFVRENGV